MESAPLGQVPYPGTAAATVSAAIETHPARLEQARKLQARLAPMDTYLAVDPDPDGPRRAMRSARLAFAAANTQHTHHLVVQDDVWVPDGFADAARQAAELYPDAVISLFVEWSLPTATLARWAALIGASAVPVIENYAPTQAALVPSEFAVEYARYLRTEVPTDSADDVALLHFARRTGTPALLLVPNLVEHDRDANGPSLTGNDWQGARRSVCFMSDSLVGDRPRVLEVPTMVPFVQWDGNFSMMVYAHPYGVGGWRPTLDVLAEWGTGLMELTDACRSVLRAWPAYRTILERVDADQLFAVWVTAVAMGAIQAVLWPASAAALQERLLDRPVFAQSLRTMAPGALRREVELEFLAEHAVYLDALVVHGMTYGAQACRPNFADIKPISSFGARPAALVH